MKTSGFWGLKVGERVFVSTSKQTYGPGTIKYISTDEEMAYGSQLYPSYYVEFDTGDYGWFKGVSLNPSKE